MVKSIAHIILLTLSLPLFGQTFQVSAVESSLRGSVYGPAFHNSRIVVCSDQKDRVVGKTVLDLYEKEPVNLFILDPENPSGLSRFADEFRTIYNDGPISFNGAADACVISRNLKTEQGAKGLQEDHNPLGLFVSKKYAGIWDTPSGLSFNNPEYNCSHPAMSSDGRTIIFTSNMPGGLGGYDLWMTTYDAGIWSRPVNLGNRINSEKDELFPSIDNDQIYFASDRGEFGGLDIYYTDLNSNRSVKALNPPINSEADDFGLITRNGLESGFFTTNRAGEDALWKFNFQWPEFGSCDSLIEEDFCYTLFEENAQELEDVGSLIYEWSINGVKRRGVSIRYCFPGPGDYEINLDVIDSVINETYFNQAYYSISLEYAVQPYIDCPDTVRPNTEFALTADKTNLPGVSIGSYFWDLGDGTKTIGRDIEHRFQIPGTYRVRLGVLGRDGDSSITDCVYKTVVCSDTAVIVKDNLANLIPSTLANSEIVKEVKFYNVGPEEEGFVAYTIEAFRSDEAVNLSKFPYTLLEQYSSRVEYDEDKEVYIYYVGEYEKFTEAHDTWLTLKERGFDDAILRSILLDESATDISLTEKFVLEHVNFDVAKWDIRPDAIPDLEKIVSIMRKAPEYNLEISAHTDNKGDRKENDELSNKRAIAVKDYLMKHGIEGGRISAKGYGQDQPIDTNETDEGRQRNRRVEFKFRKA